MSDSPLSKKSNDKPEVQFTADKIGHWASKQENPFAEQNRKAAARKQREHEQAKKATPIVAIILGIAAVVAAVGGLVVLIVFLINSQPKPEVVEIAGSSAQDIADYRDILNNFYNQDPYATTEDRIQNIENIVNGTLDSANGKDNSDAVLCAQAYLYYNNGLYQEVVNVGGRIDVGRLDDGQKANIYEAMANSYYMLGDQENADVYYSLLLSTPVGGAGYGG